jgi:hypothetical protein
MSRVISFVAGAAAFAVGFGITPQLPQSIDHRPVHYLAPPAPDVTASMAATIVDRSRKGDRLSRSAGAEREPAIATVEVDGFASPTIVYRDGVGRELFRADPGMKLTVVAKGAVLPAITIRRGERPITPVTAPVAPKGPAMRCEPAFSSPGDPTQTNLPGRCLASEGKTKLAAVAD